MIQPVNLKQVEEALINEDIYHSSIFFKELTDDVITFEVTTEEALFEISFFAEDSVSCDDTPADLINKNRVETFDLSKYIDGNLIYYIQYEYPYIDYAN